MLAKLVLVHTGFIT